jgi:alpha-1,3-mannosyltransferase
MKILHITNQYWPCIGGVEKTIEKICENTKNKIQSTVLCLNKCHNNKKILKENEEHNKVKIKRIPFIDLKYYKIAPKIFFYPKKEFDLIHVHGIGFFSDAILITKIFHKKPVIISTYGNIFHTKKLFLLKKIYFNTIQKALFCLADKVIVISKADENKTKEITNNTEYAPIGIDLPKNQSKPPKKKNTFLFVGRYSKNKRIDLLIKAFKKIKEKEPNAKLTIIGKDFDNIKEKLYETTKKEKLEKNIEFLETTTNKELKKKYNETEYFLSASEYESFGISLIEAMASKCIPITNKIPAFCEIIENKKNGFLIDYEKEPETITQVFQLSENEKKTLQENARKKAEEYAWERKIIKYLQIYNETGNKK